MSSLKIAALELKRVFSARPLRLALVVICMVPVFYGGLWLWAFWDPYAQLDTLPVAVVNLDQPVKADSTTLDIGAELTDTLRENAALDWDFVPAQRAKQGLEDGDYYMTLTIPANMSRRLADADSDDAKAAVLTVTANESTNLLASQIGRQAFVELRSSLAQVTTRRYLDNILVGIGDTRIGLNDAAGGAKKLAAALRSASSGSATLADGISSAGSGASSLSTGLGKLSSGAATLRSGTSTLAGGANSLAGGVSKASRGADSVAAGSRTLVSGTSDLAGGLGTLVTQGGKLTSGAAELNSGATQVSGGVATLAAKTGEAATSAGQLAGGATQVTRALQAFAAKYPDEAKDPYFQAALSGAGSVASGLSTLSGGLTAAAPSANTLASGAAKVAAGAAALDTGLSGYVAGVGTAASGARTLSAGAGKLSAGAGSLAGGLSTAQTGAKTLAAGTRSVAAGSSSLADGAAEARSGSAALTSGLLRLTDGGKELSSGLELAASGGNTLATALAAGAGKVPTLTKRQRETRSGMMSAPVELDNEATHPVPTYGTSFAPFFIALALWLGALMTYFLVRALNGRALSSTLSDSRVTFAGLWPAVAITWLQAGILAVVVQFGLHLDPVQPLAYYALILVAAFAFTAILQFLSAALGTAGKFVAVVLLMLQLTSAAGTFPLETVPRFFQVINPLLPMTYVVSGLRQAISGGDLSVVAWNTLVLLAFAAGAIVLTMLVTRKRRMWTMDQLKPVLTIQ